MLVGVQGYLKIEDKYDLILPEVSSWSLDKRTRSYKLNNYSGGFSATPVRNNESRYYSITWDALPENNISEEFTNSDTYDIITRNLVAKTITTDTSLSITPVDFNIPAGTSLWFKKTVGFDEVITTAPYTANSHTIRVKSKSGNAVTVLAGQLIAKHKVGAAGLLTLVGLSATGNSHYFRDFLGNLVKVVFNSPKYNAIGGSDEYNQMYYDVNIEVDMVIDTATISYQTVKAVNGSVHNETLPSVSTVGNVSGTFDMSNLFVIDTKNNIGYISKSALTEQYKLLGAKPFIPYVPAFTVGDYLDTFKDKLGLFEDYISTNTLRNLEVKVGDNVVRAADNPAARIVLGQMENFITLGPWSAVENYGIWDTVDLTKPYMVPKGRIVRSGNKVYMSLVDNNSEPVTKTKAWKELPDNTVFVVIHNNKRYKMLKPSKNKQPDQNPAEWAVYDIPSTDFKIQLTEQFASTLTSDSAVILVMAPFSIQDTSIPPTANKSSIILKLPIVDGTVLPDLDFNDTTDVIKVSNLFVSADKTVDAFFIKDSIRLNHISGIGFKSNAHMRSSIGVATSTNVSKVIHSRPFNIEQINTQRGMMIVSYVSIDKATQNLTLSNGTCRLQYSLGTVSVNHTFSKDYVPTQSSVSFNYSSMVSENTSTLLQSFNQLTTDNKLLEIIFNPLTNETIVNEYSIEVNDPLIVSTITDNKYDPENSGLSLKKVRKQYKGVSTLSTTNTEIKFEVVGSGMFNTFATYIMQPISEPMLCKYFGLQDGNWL